MKTLNDLAVGDQALVRGFEQGKSAFRKKLLSMGLTPGTELKVTRYAPLGDPVEIQVRGFSLTLRKSEADMLIIEKTK
ncbi:MAG: ferrous iron transport protein A [SAR324 cluster bacterium]|nr:ferrous iron transport protein A [SAR324 cluster bacterium]MBL7036049.1 ferrous iron transport protein A [SAR324 cluster bacterium]